MINPLVLSSVFSIGTKLIDRFFPDPTLAAAAKLELITLQQNGELAVMANETNLALAQIGVNAEEAKSSSIFISGWRPAAGWVCVAGLGYVSIVEPLARFAATMFGYVGTFPVIDTYITLQILLGMLGLASARSFDKFNGVAAK